MSVKIMGLVWDYDIPRDEKFVLLAYADHASHDGENVYPSVATISKKTGYSERSIQSITRKLQDMGLLITDGKGKNGTNKWRIPLSWEGANSAPAKSAGVQNEAEGGAKPKLAGVQAPAPESSPTVNQPSVKEASPKANQIKEISLYREVTEKYPAKASWHSVVQKMFEISKRLGHEPTKDDLVPFYVEWCNRGWLSTSINWLDYAVRGELPANFKSTRTEPKGFDAIHSWMSKQEEFQNG